MLPGYGIHYVGEQQFYAFYLSVQGASSGAKDPFQTDPTKPNGVLNVVLVSRASYLSTNLSANQSAGSLGAVGCLGSAQVTTRNLGGSQLGLAGTLSATVTDSCANTLLANLMPHNSTGNITGTYYSLSTPQVQLLGLDAGASQVAPFMPIPGFDSVQGGLPSQFNWGWFPILGGVIVAVGNFFHVPAIVALGNWVANLPAEVAAAVAYLGQIVVGIWNAVVSAVEVAVQAALNALNFLAQLAESILEVAFNYIVNAISNAISAAVAALIIPLLSDLLYTNVSGKPLLTTSEFDNAYHQQTGNPSPPPPQSESDAVSALNSYDQQLIDISVGGFIAVGAVVWLVTALTAGADSIPLQITTMVGKRVAQADLASFVATAISSVAMLGLYFGVTGSSTQLATALEAVGFSSTLAAFAITSLQAFTALSSSKVQRWNGFFSNARLGLFISFAAMILSGIYDSVAKLLKTVETNTQDNALSGSIFYCALVGALFGAFGVGYTALPIWRAVAVAAQVDSLALVVLVMNGIGLAFGVGMAESNPPQ